MYSQAAPGQAEKVVLGTKISPGTKITTLPQSQSDFQLPEKELKIRLKENSDAVGGSFAFLKEKKRRGQVELRRGVMFIKIDQGYNGTFTVVTPTVEVTATGTAFCVEVYGALGDTWVGMLDGTTQVKNLVTDEKMELRRGDELDYDAEARKTEVSALEEDEKEILEQEIRRIGSGLPEELQPKIELVLPKNKERLETFMTKTAIATNGKEPLRVHRLLMKALHLMEEGIVEEKKETLLKSIAKLEEALLFYSDPRYAPQLLMFVGAYYKDFREYWQAVAVFEKVRDLYPDSSVASLAVAAMGRLYEEKLDKLDKAQEMYEMVLEKYGDSFEKEEAMNGLDRVRAKKNE